MKHTQFTVGSPGLIWHCRGARNHDNDTGVVARGQHGSITRTHRVCKAEFPLLGPNCPVGESKPRQNTHNPQLALQGSFGTAEGHETMTTTPKTSLLVNAGPQHARTAYTKDGSSQKAKQKRLISVISLFSLVLERRAAGEKAPSSAHREKAKSAFFLANNGVPLRSVCRRPPAPAAKFLPQAGGFYPRKWHFHMPLHAGAPPLSAAGRGGSLPSSLSPVRA